MLSLSSRYFLFALLAGTLLLCDPALANKFETIGGGVSGSMRLKREFLQTAFLVGGIGFLVAAALAVIVPHTNAAFLNFANWKASSVVLEILGAVMLVSHFLV